MEQNRKQCICNFQQSKSFHSRKIYIKINTVLLEYNSDLLFKSTEFAEPENYTNELF